MATQKEIQQHETIRTFGYFGVFLSLLAMLTLMPVLTNSYYSFVGLQGCLVILLMSLNCSLSTRKGARGMGYWVVFLFIALDCLGLYTNSLDFMIMAYAIFVLYLLAAIVLLLRLIFNAPIIDNNLMFAALTVYLLIGILWGKLYFMDALLYPGSFRGLDDVVHQANSLGVNFVIQFDLLYYSFTTLATLGMGDISPSHHLSKSLTIMEAMFGQLFVAVVIAKLVSVWRRIE